MALPPVAAGVIAVAIFALRVTSAFFRSFLIMELFKEIKDRITKGEDSSPDTPEAPSGYAPNGAPLGTPGSDHPADHFGIPADERSYGDFSQNTPAPENYSHQAPRGTPGSTHPGDFYGPPPGDGNYGSSNHGGTAPNGAPRGTPGSDHPGDWGGGDGGNSGGSNGGDGGGDGGNSGGGNGGNSGGFKPIVLDLDGDGVELVSLDESAVFYDINVDGYRYNLGWAAADDGLLVYDKGDDGVISQKDEISFVDYVEGARTDLEGLRHFDSNGDGVLDAADAEFAKFKVWQDADQDGEVDSGELRTLEEAGVKSIDLTYSPGDDGQPEARDGNTIFGEGRYQKMDGTHGIFADVAFAASAVGFKEEGGELVFKISEREPIKTYLAPEGATQGLNIDFASDAHASYSGAIGTAHGDVLNGTGVKRDLLLLGGAGADRLTGGSGDDWLQGGAGADTLHGGAGHDVLLFDSHDTIFGGEGFDVGIASGPGALNMDLHALGLEAVYGDTGDDVLSTSGTQGIVVQGGGGADRITGGTGSDVLSGDAGADVIAGGDGDDFLLGGTGADTIKGGAGDDVLYVDSTDAFSGGEGWDTVVFTDDGDHNVDLLERGVERVFGGDGDDSFHIQNDAASYPLHLYGRGGDDVLVAGVAEDFLHGGKGEDMLRGGYRDDTYYFERGDGRDRIFDDFRHEVTFTDYQRYTHTYRKRIHSGQDSGWRTVHETRYRAVTRQKVVQEDAGMDVLRFGAGIVAADLLLQRDGDDLLVGLKEDGASTVMSGLSDMVRIKDWANEKNRVEMLAFADGTRLGVEDIATEHGLSAESPLDLGKAMADAYQGATLAGTAADDLLFGGSGDDVIYGAAGDDTLSGKAGVDKLYGGSGSDEYVFGRGDGQDRIFDDYRKEITVTSREPYTYKARVYHHGYGQGSGYYSYETRTGYRTVSRQEIVQEDGGIDVLRFGAGIVAADLLLQRDGDDLLVGLKEDDAGAVMSELSDVVRIEAWANEKNRVDIFSFADGTRLRVADVISAFGVTADGKAVDLGQVAGDGSSRVALVGTSGADELVGGGNHDVLYGADGNDTLVGNASGDRLYGGAGDDTYVFNRGDGYDHIYDDVRRDQVSDSGREVVQEDGGADVLRFGAGIEASDLMLFQYGDDLYVIPKKDKSEHGALDMVRIKDWSNEKNRIEVIAFADGTRLRLDNIATEYGLYPGVPVDLGKAMADAYQGATLAGTAADDLLFGGSGDDVIYGAAGEDTLSGKAGVDKLYGGGGSDEYVFGRGDGRDRIFDDHRQEVTITSQQRYTYKARVFHSYGQGEGYYSYETRTGYRTVSRQEVVQEDGGIDVLRFGAGIVAADLLLQRDGDDLLVGLKEDGASAVMSDLSDVVRIEDWANEKNRVDIFSFADGARLRVADVLTAFGVTAEGKAVDLGQVAGDGSSRVALVGTSGADELVGGDGGGDVLYGGDGDDTLSGKGGSDDRLYGGAGADTYVFNLGDGIDIIFDDVRRDQNGVSGREVVQKDGGEDVLQFGAGIVASDLVMAYHGDILYVGVDKLGYYVPDWVFIEGWSNEKNRIEILAFADGTRLRFEDIAATYGLHSPGTSVYLGEAMADAHDGATLAGTSAGDSLFGGGGDDVIYGAAGDDTLSGKAGVDKLYGGSGSDEYVFGRGGGQDRIFDDHRQEFTVTSREPYTYQARVYHSYGQGSGYYSYETRTGYRTVSRQEVVQEDGGIDVLRFGAGIVASDLLLQRDGDDLLVGLKEDGAGAVMSELSDVVRIEDWANEKNRVEAFVFEDGKRLRVADVLAAFQVIPGQVAVDLGQLATGTGLIGTDAANELTGGSGNDVLYGADGDDTLVGNAGGDRLYGGAGADTYVFGRGDGIDQIFDDARREQSITVQHPYTYVASVTVHRSGQEGGTYSYSVTRTGYRTIAGKEVVQEDGGEDVLRFGAGIVASDLLLQRDGNDLLVGLKEDGASTVMSELSDMVRIKDWANEKNRVEVLAFADGTRLSVEDIVTEYGLSPGMPLDLGKAMADAYQGATLAGTSVGDSLFGGSGDDVIYGAAGEDNIVGGEGADRLIGGAGDDLIEGGAGDDVILGGSGDDILHGEGGSDTYHFYKGNDKDTVRDSGGADDRVVLGPDIKWEDLWLSRHGDDLKISILNGGDEMVVKNQFASAGVESFELSDGSHLEWGNVDSLIYAMAGFDKPDDGLPSSSTQGSSVSNALSHGIFTASIG